MKVNVCLCCEEDRFSTVQTALTAGLSPPDADVEQAAAHKASAAAGISANENFISDSFISLSYIISSIHTKKKNNSRSFFLYLYFMTKNIGLCTNTISLITDTISLNIDTVSRILPLWTSRAQRKG